MSFDKFFFTSTSSHTSQVPPPPLPACRERTGVGALKARRSGDFGRMGLRFANNPEG